MYFMLSLYYLDVYERVSQVVAKIDLVAMIITQVWVTISQLGRNWKNGNKKL